MGFSTNPAHVRADFFTDDQRLKWKYTEALDMSSLWDFMQVHHAIALSCWRFGRHHDLTVVVLEPYHRFSHPIMLTPRDRTDLAMHAYQHRHKDLPGLGYPKTLSDLLGVNA